MAVRKQPEPTLEEVIHERIILNERMEVYQDTEKRMVLTAEQAAQAKTLVRRLYRLIDAAEVEVANPVDPFMDKLSWEAEEWLRYRANDGPVSTHKLAKGLSRVMLRAGKTLEQTHLPKLAEAGFAHCAQSGRRTIWHYSEQTAEG